MLLAIAFKLGTDGTQFLADRVVTASGTRTYYVQIYDDGDNKLRLSTYHGGGGSVFSWPTAIAVDEWHDVVIAWNGTTRWVFIDGEEVDQVTIGGALDDGDGDEWLGCDYLQSQQLVGELAMPLFDRSAEPSRGEARALAYHRALYLGLT